MGFGVYSYWCKHRGKESEDISVYWIKAAEDVLDIWDEWAVEVNGQGI